VRGLGLQQRAYNSLDDHLSKGEAQALLQPLQTLLSSQRSTDDIQIELAELIGFDDLELVTDIIEQRSVVTSEVSYWLIYPLFHYKY
jgi:hypothetical protein